MSDEGQPRPGMMRCIQAGCEGHLAASGQEAFRLICEKCSQNYFVRLVVEPVPPKRDLILPAPVDRAE